VAALLTKSFSIVEIVSMSDPIQQIAETLAKRQQKKG
jgi:hypothetical protein